MGNRPAPFNPTVIRLAKAGTQTAMVIANHHDSDIYFQVYVPRGKTGTFLEYAMPWSTEVLAIEEFDQWVKRHESHV